MHLAKRGGANGGHILDTRTGGWIASGAGSQRDEGNFRAFCLDEHALVSVGTGPRRASAALGTTAILNVLITAAMEAS